MWLFMEGISKYKQTWCGKVYQAILAKQPSGESKGCENATADVLDFFLWCERRP
jgi:hypothetical protein